MNTCLFRPMDIQKDSGLVSSFLEETAAIGNMHFESIGDYTGCYLKFIEETQPDNPAMFAMCCQSGKVIGFAGAAPSVKYPEYGMISFIYLIPEKRRTGLGRILEEYALNQLKLSGCRKARLTVSSENHAAVEFYLKQGWSKIREEEGTPMIYRMGKVIDA